MNTFATETPGGNPVDGTRRQGFVPLPTLFLALLLTTAGCARKEPARTQTTAILAGRLQQAAQRTDQAQTANRAVGTHLERMELSRVDGKAEVIREWLKAQP